MYHVRLGRSISYPSNGLPGSVAGRLTLVLEDEPSADELAWIGARPRDELVHPSAVPAGDIDVAILVHVELVRTRQATRKAAPRPSVRAPVVPELAVPAVLEYPVQCRRDHPDPVVLIDEDADGIRNVGPFLEELTVLREDLDAVVRAVADIDAVIPVYGDAVDEVELSRAAPELASLHHVLAVCVVLDDAGVPVTVAEEKAAVREEGQHRRIAVGEGTRA